MIGTNPNPYNMAEEDNKLKTLRIKKDIFQKIWDKGIPLFFFNKDSEWNSSMREHQTVWKPENASIESKLYGDKAFEHAINDVAFIYAKPFNYPQNNLSDDLVEIEYEEFKADDYNHVKAVFLLHLSHRYNAQDKYACRELLWYLNNYFLNYEILNRVLGEFDAQSIRPFFVNELKNYALCLPIPKQSLIQRIVSNLGGSYTIYFPTPLSEAIKTIYPNYNVNSDWKSNIFDLVRRATLIPKDDNANLSYDVMKDNDISNFFLQIRRWLADPEYSFTDFDMLMRMLRLFSPSQQMLVLNRYFFAIKQGQASFDIELLKKFKVNQFDNWGIYYHCANRGSKPVLIGLQLMCDNILTFLSSGGQALQTINGTLDMAYSQCNVNNPAVDFQLDRIVPICNGGAIPNKSGFKGFICYEVIYTVNNELFHDDKFISDFTMQIINIFGRRHFKYECGIHGDNFSACEKKSLNPNACLDAPRCENYRTVYLDKWTFNASEKQCTIVNIFLKNKQLINDRQSEITLEDINPNVAEIRQKLLKFISDTLKAKPAHGNFPQGYIYPDTVSYDSQYIYRSILKPVWMQIEPRNNVYIGLGLLAPKIGVNLEDYGSNREGTDCIRRKETDYIKPIIVSSMQSIIGTAAESDGKFYLSFDAELLRKLQATFYSTKSSPNGDNYHDRDLCFLQRSHSFYKSYCAPEYTGDTNKATNLPYFWCRGRECYMNALYEQTLATCKSWRYYNIFHLLEILGYPQISKTEAGFEASKLIRDFIGMVNKAAQLFRRVICRECGHILFPIKRNSFNQYNNFECYNPICSAKGVRVYLSQCHHCKSGMIDSRDSKSCPNGWRICPTCLSCCTDDQIEFQAQKYIRSRRPMPEFIQRTRTHGHNDKNQYFCPKCGGEIVKAYDEERGETHVYCSVCHSPYPKAVEWI